MPPLVVGAVAVAGAVTVAGLGWWAFRGEPRLTPLTSGFRMCAPANADGEVVYGWDVFRNDSAEPIRVAEFVPAEPSGVTVVGGYFLIDDEEGPRGAIDDPRLVPHGWAFEVVPPGSKATLVMGLQLTDLDAGGRINGGDLVGEGPRGVTVGQSSTQYLMVPAGDVCQP